MVVSYVKCAQCGGSKRDINCNICLNCQRKRGLIVLGIAALLLILFGLFMLISSADMPEPKCRTIYTLENGVVCRHYGANDFGSSHAEKCSDEAYYENPSNVKKTKVCKNDAILGDSA